jgi:hypothetical protein
MTSQEKYDIHFSTGLGPQPSVFEVHKAIFIQDVNLDVIS